MRIFVRPPEIGGPFKYIAQQPHDFLREAGIASAPVGGST
jgi:hypothetical protein